jgi:hypothetical protein
MASMPTDPVLTPSALPTLPTIQLLPDDDRPRNADNAAELMLTCANCGAPMDERKCKLICRCGYFLSCSDYL